MQSLIRCVEDFGLYYESNRELEADLKQRNATIFYAFKRSPQLQSGEGLKKIFLGDQIGA